MTSSQKKIITVVGATGRQGGGLIDYALKDGTFALRGVTRNKDSQASKELEKRGVEMVVAELDDVQSLKKAFTGTYGVFGVTDYWTVFDKEKDQGKNLVDAAKATGVKHFVWSTIDRCYVNHFNTKADIDDYLKQSGVPRTSIYTCFFYDNILAGFLGFTKDTKREGGIVMTNDAATDGPKPSMYSGDVGAYALLAFKDPKRWINQNIDAVTEIITYRQVAERLSKILKVPVRIEREVTLEEYMAQKKEGIDHEVWLNFKYYYENPNLRGEPEASRALVEKPLGIKLRDLNDVLTMWGWKVVNPQSSNR